MIGTKLVLSSQFKDIYFSLFSFWVGIGIFFFPLEIVEHQSTGETVECMRYTWL